MTDKPEVEATGSGLLGCIVVIGIFLMSVAFIGFCIRVVWGAFKWGLGL